MDVVSREHDLAITSPVKSTDVSGLTVRKKRRSRSYDFQEGKPILAGLLAKHNVPEVRQLDSLYSA